MTSSNTQRGQIIVLFALVLVGLLAFAGLAIDGAMIYSDRRADQSAADSASLAGGGAGAQYMQLHDINFKHDFTCSDLNIAGRKMNLVKHEIIDAAIIRAEANGFTIDGDITDDNGIKVTCTSNGTDKFLDVEVSITTQTETNFIHLFNDQPMKNTVTAVTRIRPTRPSAGGFALAALNEDNCKQGGNSEGGVFFDGNVDTILEGGGVYSATCITKNGKSGDIYVNNADPGIYRTELNPSALQFKDENGNLNAPDHDANFELDVDIPKPDCAGMTEYFYCNKKKGCGTNTYDGSNPLEPGIYPDGIGITATLKPGLYCIDGDITSGDLTGKGVTLYMRNSASIKLTGKETLTLYAPSTTYPANSPAEEGLLFYFDGGDFEMTGQGTAYLIGTIYAPAGSVKLGGTSALNGSFTTEIIANDIKIHGNPGTGIQYDASQFYNRPPTLDLHR